MIRFLYLSAVILLVWACQTKGPKETDNSEKNTTTSETKTLPK